MCDHIQNIYNFQCTWQGDKDKLQSPININTNELKPHNISLEMNNYDNLEIAKKIHNQYTFSIAPCGNSHIILNGKTFKLDEVHMHRPGEHSIDGKHPSAEMHLVHKNNDEIAVLALLLEVAEVEDCIISNILKDGTVINLLGNSTPDIFMYNGSLTTPPLSYNVNWLVSSESIKVSQNGLDMFINTIHSGPTNRELQELQERDVFLVKPVYNVK